MRPTITTPFTPRVKPTTQYTRPREGMCITWDEANFTWDSTNLTWDELCTTLIVTAFTRPRYASLLELENWINIQLENWVLLETEWGAKDNIIDTIFT